MLAEVRLTSSTETLPVTGAGQKKKGHSKIISLMKESKDDESVYLNEIDRLNLSFDEIKEKTIKLLSK